MDDFSVFWNSYEDCLDILEVVLDCYKETNLVLNLEKCHFMVIKEILLEHKISCKEFEVDPAKVDVVEKLPSPSDSKTLKGFLGHARFYRIFIKRFS